MRHKNMKILWRTQPHAPQKVFFRFKKIQNTTYTISYTPPWPAPAWSPATRRQQKLLRVVAGPARLAPDVVVAGGRPSRVVRSLAWIVGGRRPPPSTSSSTSACPPPRRALLLLLQPLHGPRRSREAPARRSSSSASTSWTIGGFIVSSPRDALPPLLDVARDEAVVVDGAGRGSGWRGGGGCGGGGVRRWRRGGGGRQRPGCGSSPTRRRSSGRCTTLRSNILRARAERVSARVPARRPRQGRRRRRAVQSEAFLALAARLAVDRWIDRCVCC